MNNTNIMASIDEVSKLRNAERTTTKKLSALYGCTKSYTSCINERLTFIDESTLSSGCPNLLVNYSKKVSLTRTTCYCHENKQGEMKYRSKAFRLLVARYATVITLSMLMLLASAQDVNSQQSSRGTSNSFSDKPLNPNKSLTLQDITPNKVQIHRNTKELNMSTAVFSGTHGVSMNRNSLISSDNVLQRQLREKAKKDSLESIKMHILMRLNLKRLPNITKPISVPQNILENFYKNYNTSILNSMWNHGNTEETPSRTELYVSAENVAESSKNVLNTTKDKNNSDKNKTIEPNLKSENSSTDNVRSNGNLSSEMQGDDPNGFNEFQFIYNRRFDDQRNFAGDGEYQSILSHISSIYVFPEQSHVRHNRRTDVLRFKFDTSYSDISYVTLHLYLRGLDWIGAHHPKIIEEIQGYEDKDIVVTVYRAIRRANSTSYTHMAKIFEFRHKIPSGLGEWVNVDIKPLFGSEMSMVNYALNKTEELFIKGVETWMKPLVVTTDSTSRKPLTVHIEIGSRKKHRRKRSVFMDCTENDHDMRCCRYPLKVNFTSFGWHFVVAPTSFDAYFCSGDCRVGYLEQYPHTHLAALTTSATPCCSPTKMSSLSLLYFDDNHNLVLSVIPNMSVEGCSCS